MRVCEYTVYSLFAIRLIFHLIVGLTNLGYLAISLAPRVENLVPLHIDLLKLRNAVLESLLHLNCLLVCRGALRLLILLQYYWQRVSRTC